MDMKKFTSLKWKNVNLPDSLLGGLTRAFELNLYSAFLQHEPNSVEILVEIGNLYTRLGQVKEGLQVDERLVKINPKEPLFHYNLACSQSLLGQVDSALDSLQRAIGLGYHNLEYMVQDEDLENARKDRRFQDLIRQAREAKKPPKKRPQQEVQ